MSIRSMQQVSSRELLNRPNIVPNKVSENARDFSNVLNNTIRGDLNGRNANEINPIKQNQLASQASTPPITNVTGTSASTAVNKADSPPVGSSSLSKESTTEVNTQNKPEPVKIMLEGNSLVIKIDPSISGNLTINLTKNPDNTFTINVIDHSQNRNQNTVPTTPNQPTLPNPSTPNPQNVNPNQPTIPREEWMIPGRDYTNPAPAYSPVTGKPLNISVGQFYAMMDRNSWNPITRTHSEPPTGQSWKQFREMLEAGLDPYVTMFY